MDRVMLAVWWNLVHGNILGESEKLLDPDINAVEGNLLRPRCGSSRIWMQLSKHAHILFLDGIKGILWLECSRL